MVVSRYSASTLFLTSRFPGPYLSQVYANIGVATAALCGGSVERDNIGRALSIRRVCVCVCACVGVCMCRCE